MGKKRISLYVLLVSTAAGTAISACGGSNNESKLANPPPQCPAGTVFDGQQCVASSAPTATATSTSTAPPPPTGTATTPPPIPTATGGNTAAPLDPAAAGAVVPLLDPLAKQHAPPGARPVGGAALAGNFQPGQSLEIQVQMQPGACYTVVGAALPTVQNLDIQIAAAAPIPGLSPVLATDQTTGPTAVVGAKPNCFKWAAPMAAPMRIILGVSAGQGLAAAQVYQK